ncbi:MAG: lysophospholipid acyltransferase family protein [Gammaproteobacteria bacterium]|nr:lysophospholipid acyltransferase family protein [Gammaproteobacteria bacterium]
MPWKMALRIGGGFGRFIGFLMSRKENRALENFHRAGVPNPIQACRQAWGHLGKTPFEMMWNLGHSPDRAMRNVVVKGIESLQEASRMGRGVLLVSGHMGNWELVSVAASKAGVPIAVVARPMRTPRLERHIIDFRQKNSIRTLLRGTPGSSVAAYRWLRRGRILGCMMDRSSNGKRVLVPFLGQGMKIPFGPAELAGRLGVPVVLGWAVRNKDGNTRVSFRLLPTEGIRNPFVIAGIVGKALQEEIKKHPEQWMWIFRQQPCWNEKSTIQTGEGMEKRIPVLQGQTSQDGITPQF